MSLEQVEQLVKKGDKNAAFSGLIAIYGRSRADHATLRRVAFLFEQINCHSPALEVWEYLISRLPDDIDLKISALNARCKLAKMPLDFRAPERDLDILVRHSQLSITQRHAASVVFQKCRNLAKAIDVLTRGVGRELLSYDYHLRLAYLYSFSGSAKKAVAQLNKVLDISDLTPSQCHESGLLAKKCGYVDVDLLFARRQYRGSPLDANAIEHLASALIAEQAHDEARLLLPGMITSVTNTKTSVNTFLRLVDVLCALSEPNYEQALLSEALKQHPGEESLIRIARASEFIPIQRK